MGLACLVLDANSRLPGLNMEMSGKDPLPLWVEGDPGVLLDAKISSSRALHFENLSNTQLSRKPVTGIDSTSESIKPLSLYNLSLQTLRWADRDVSFF